MTKKPTSGGSREIDMKLPTVIPTGPAGAIAVTTLTAVGT